MPERSQTASDTPFADQLVRRVMVAYPNQAPQVFGDEILGKEAWRLWREELAEMAKRFGETRVSDSITRWIRRSEYMPEISQIRDGIQPILNPEPRYDQNCACQGMGFRQLPGDKRRFVKCDCYKRRSA